jgi:hypothetical protein
LMGMGAGVDWARRERERMGRYTRSDASLRMRSEILVVEWNQSSRRAAPLVRF